MADSVRSFQIELGIAEVIETEDFGSDGDEIYVLGSLVASSPSQGVVDTQLFAKNPTFIRRFNERTSRQQLQPQSLYSKTLPDDTQVSLTLKFVDADDEASEDGSLSQEAFEMLQQQFNTASDRFADQVRSRSRNLIVRAVLEFVKFLFDLIPTLDDDDILGTDTRSFNLATAESKEYPFNLNATMDGANYKWAYKVKIGAPEAVVDVDDVRNALPGDRVIRPVTPQPVPPTRNVSNGPNRQINLPDRAGLRDRIIRQPTRVTPRTDGNN